MGARDLSLIAYSTLALMGYEYYRTDCVVASAHFLTLLAASVIDVLRRLQLHPAECEGGGPPVQEVRRQLVTARSVIGFSSCSGRFCRLLPCKVALHLLIFRIVHRLLPSLIMFCRSRLFALHIPSAFCFS